MRWKIEKNLQRFNEGGCSGVEFQDGEQLLAHSLWYSWIRIFLIKKNRLLEAVEIGRTIWATFEVPKDLAARTGPKV